MSNPTRTKPKSLSFGPTCSHIHKSFSVSDLATAEAPAAKFPLSSPTAGTLATAAFMGIPLINNTLLSQDAVKEIENLNRYNFEDGDGIVDTQSLGFLLHELIKNTFPNDDLKKLSDEIKQDYNGFQEKLQNCREFRSLNIV